MTPPPSAQEVKAPFELVGNGQPTINMLPLPPEGRLGVMDEADKAREKLRREYASKAGIEEVFAASRWTFAPDGTFRFTPSPLADLRTDLYPLQGRYENVNNLIELHGERRSPAGASLTLDGHITIKSQEAYDVDVVYTVASASGRRVARITQSLTRGRTSSPAPDERTVAGVPVPSTFRVTLTGSIDDQDFGSFTATFRLLPSPSGGTESVRLRLETEAMDRPGQLTWFADPPDPSAQPQQQRVLIVNAGKIHFGIQADKKEPLIEEPLISWVVQDTVMPGFPVQAHLTTGHLKVSIDGAHLTGTISAEGVTWFRKKSEYKALLTGERLIESEPPGSLLPPERVPQASEAAEAPGPEKGFAVPSMFDVTLQGTSGSDDFGPLAAQLALALPQPNSPHPLEISLTTQEPMQHGWLSWIPMPRGEHTERAEVIHIDQGTVRMEVQPSTVMRSLSWKFESKTEAGIVQASDMVQVERGTLTFTIANDTIEGEIHATGLGLTKDTQEQTYTARFKGQKQHSPLADDLRANIQKFNVTGQWSTLPTLFGEIMLQHEEQTVWGTYTAEGGGKLQGRVEGTLITLTWEDHARGTGWGFWRALPGEHVLIGLKGSGTNKTAGELMVALKVSPTTQDTSPLTPRDAQHLRYLGQDLALQGRCEQAITPLTKALAFYRTALETGTGSSLDKENTRLNMVSILTHLIECAFQREDYTPLVAFLTEALRLQRELGPTVAPQEIQQDMTTNASQELAWYAERLKRIRDQVADFNNLFTTARVGMRLEPDEEHKAVRVADVVATGPAALAGIQMGDIIEKVEDEFVQVKDIATITRRLRGAVGTFVTVTVQRGGTSTPITMMRAFLPIPTHRPSDELLQLLTSFDTILMELLQMSPAMEARLQQLRDVGRALVRDQIEIQQAQEALFALWDQQRELSRTANARIWQTREQALQVQLEQNSVLSSIEKDLIRLQMRGIELGTALAFILHIQKDHAQRLSPETQILERADYLHRASPHLMNSLERWRARLVIDQDKMKSLDAGHAFFRQLIALYFEMIEAGFMSLPKDMNLSKKVKQTVEAALLASEASRARAFVDLLAADRRKLQQTLTPQTSDTALRPSPVSTPPLTLSKLRAIIQARGTTTIEYFMLDDRLVIWVIDPHKDTEKDIEVITVPISRNELIQLIDQWLALVEHRKRSGNEEKARREAFIPVLRKLYGYLIAPIPTNLLPTDPDAVVTIVPHEQLLQVPFAVLQDPQGTYLLHKHALVYASSIAMLHYTRANAQRIPRPTPPTLLALVNPSPMPKDPASRQPFPALSTTAEHFAAISQFYPNSHANKIFVGEQATKAALQKQASYYSVLYFGTHAEVGILDQKDTPKKPEDALEQYGTPPEDTPKQFDMFIALATGPGEDGYLRDRDIYALNLQATLVILAACKTGGGGVGADGIDGVSRTFTLAGASSLLMSLWTVPDEHTLQQMYQFHQVWIQAGRTKAQALRQAQLWAADREADQPHLWGGFVLFGEND